MAMNDWIDGTEIDNWFLWIQYINFERAQSKLNYFGYGLEFS